MSDASPRFGLPLLEPGQAQKEMVHNEAIVGLEALTQAVAETIGDNAPPATPTTGRSWIVGDTPTGAWAGHAHMLASFTTGGWRFTTPVEGMAAWIAASGLSARFSGGSWASGALAASSVRIGGVQVVGARQPAIAGPAGGSIVDGEGRTAIAAILVALRTHGMIAP